MKMTVGPFSVATTSNGGHPPEFYAERLCDKLIYISETAPPEIKLQALAFREQIRNAALGAIHNAIRSDHTTIIAQLRMEGFEDAALLVHSLTRS